MTARTSSGLEVFGYVSYAPGHGDGAEPTDFAAVAQGRIAVTPLHFDLTYAQGIEQLSGFDLERLLAPAAREL